MNKIIKHQNDQTILDKLSAQRNLYNSAKRLRKWHFVIGVVFVVGLSVAHFFFGDCKEVESALVISSVLALIAEPLLECCIDKKRTLAAQIQQRLDNTLYGLNWDACVCGKEPTDEIICDYKDDVPADDLKDWYDVEIGEVEDENVAILLCQRENILYDSDLRNCYVTLIARIAAFLGVCILVLSFVKEWDLMRFLVFGVIPVIPIAKWFITIFKDNTADKEHLGSLENLVMEETAKALDGDRIARKTIQEIQNLLFLHRKSGNLIPGWFYRICQTKSEKRSAYSVKEFLAKYNSG